MSVGNLIIDLDHRYLLSLINQVEYALRHPEESENLRMALDQLSDYAREHFAREEKLQLRIQFRGYMPHKMAHQSLLDRLDRIISEILEESDPQQLKARSAEITTLLRDWLLDHVLKEDMKMKPDLENLPPNAIG
ncbi:hemerythrin family protein [Wenzhouxiangella sp. C33]|uniref:Hemerythrin family protein n=2 Tax=Wenzhouxiangella limi TaxID=2707351 RepID=A0A845VDZ3_9GAMM|nr:hemerythrin family protein [Wenzhouxiangella limi]